MTSTRTESSYSRTATDVSVTDDQGVLVSCPDDTLPPGQTMACTGTGVAAPGQYANVGTVTGTPPEGPDVMADDPSHYFGYVLEPAISIEKREAEDYNERKVIR